MGQDTIHRENEGIKAVTAFSRPEKQSPDFKGNHEEEEHQKWIKGTR
jgi:hypothetical protein